jgi:hypothetical protein
MPDDYVYYIRPNHHDDCISKDGFRTLAEWRDLQIDLILNDE